MFGGAGAMAHMAEASKKNREKVAEKIARYKKNSKQYSSYKQSVSNPKVEQPSKEQLVDILADIRNNAVRERKMNNIRFFITIAAIVILFALVLLLFNKF